MNLGLIGFLSLVLLPLFLGAGALRTCGVGFATDRLAYLGWSWVVGATGTALLTFVWLWTGAPMNWALPLQLVLAVVAAVLYIIGSRREVVATPARHTSPVWENGAFFFVVALALIVTTVRALSGSLEPICQGDDAAFWSMKAKIIFTSGGFNQRFADVMSISRIIYHKDYPLLSPLLHVWTFANAGEITQVVNRVPMQMFSVALVLILAAALRRVARPAVAGALLLCVLPLPEMIHQARTAYVDNMVAVGVVMAFDSWARWRRSTSEPEARAWWRIFCLALTFTVWSKHEGLLYVLAMLAAWAVGVALEHRGRFATVRTPRVEKRMLLLPVGIVLLTWSFNAWFGFQSYLVQDQAGSGRSLFGAFLSQLPTRLPVILDYFARAIVLNPVHSNLLPLAFLVLLAGMPVRIWQSDLKVPTLALLFAFCAYVAVFTETPAEITSHLRTAAERVSYQIVPAIALWLAFAGGMLDPALSSRNGSARCKLGAGRQP